MPNFGVVMLLRYAKNKSFMTSIPGRRLPHLVPSVTRWQIYLFKTIEISQKANKICQIAFQNFAKY